jgi:hypothetical protein
MLAPTKNLQAIPFGGSVIIRRWNSEGSFLLVSFLHAIADVGAGYARHFSAPLPKELMFGLEGTSLNLYTIH